MQSMMIASQQQLMRRAASSAQSVNEQLLASPLSSCNNVKDNENGSASSLSPSQHLDSSSSSNSPSNGSINDSEKKTQTKPKATRKTSSLSWLNILNPSYKSRHEEFKRIFMNSIPANERLVVDYSCALQKDILIHGRIYISTNFFAFYANIFKWETNVVINCKDVAALTKANTARVIPNAIHVITNNGDKFIFTSFVGRDKSYIMMFRIWQNTLLDQPMTSNELWQWVHKSYGDDLGFTSDDDDNDDDYFPADNKSYDKISDDNCDIESQNEPNAHVTPLPSDSHENDAIDEIDNSGPINCPCESHNGKQILDVVINVNIDEAFELIFTDSQFIHNLYKVRKTSNAVVTQWQEMPSDVKQRHLSYTLTLNHPLVKSSATTEVQQLINQSKPGTVYMIQSEASVEGVPYGDTFGTHSQWCLTRESASTSRLRVHAKVIFKKSSFAIGLMKPLIEKSAIQGITDFANDLCSELPRWANIKESFILSNDQIDMNGRTLTNSIADVPIVDKLSRENSTKDRYYDKIVYRAAADGSTISQSFVEPSALYQNVLHRNDPFLLKVILAILLLLLILNIIFYIRLWNIESVSRESFSIDSDTQNIPPDDNEKWKFVISNSIKLIKEIETNLLELKSKIKVKEEL